MTIPEYLIAIDALFRSGRATEHSYRGDLQQLLASLCKGISVTNEPVRIACGAPDYILTRQQIPVGYIEAKDIGVDLGSKGLKEQFDRYKASLENLIITDYLEFRFFRGGEPTTSIRIAEVSGGKVKSLAENFGKFTALITDFAAWQGQTITSAKKLAGMMAGKARLLADVIEQAVESDEQSQQNTDLRQQLEAFKVILIHDITPKAFADLYAQTIAYGMFAARLHDPSPGSFTREEAAKLIPKSNPFLRKLFNSISGNDLDTRIEWIVDALADIFRATDIAKLLGGFGKGSGREDAFMHFYEDFLAQYDPKLRKSRGVWYTPDAVVRFIVRAVDDILKSEFGLPMGLADASTTQIEVDTDNTDNRTTTGKRRVKKTVHRVQVLDPATGTGTFLAEVVRQVHAKLQGQQGTWPQYVEQHLIPRLNGFELLMASYAMAHLKLDLVLRDTGYDMGQPHGTPNARYRSLTTNNGQPTTDNRQLTTDQQRLRIFLTNSLEEAHPDTGTLFASWLSQEANEANAVKRDTPVMVVLGNPPYAVGSSNKGKWIQDELITYKAGLNEKKLNLDDDYIKFIRYGQVLIEKTGEGILAYISNNSFIDGVTHRRMRESLLESFDTIYILDLHGNSRKDDKAQDGAKDENVFDIMQGVSINLFIKSRKSSSRRGTVQHASISGSRVFKYEQLSRSGLSSLNWQALPSAAPANLFVPFDSTGCKDYERGFAMNELFGVQNNGLKTDRDELLMDDDQQVLAGRMSRLLIGDYDNDFIVRYNVKDSGSYKITKAVKGKAYSAAHIRANHYRPFDTRWLYYDPEIISRPASKVMAHMIRGDNVSLSLPRQVPSAEASGALVSKGLCGHKVFSAYNINTVFPLYLYPETSKQTTALEQGVQPNLDAKLVEQMAQGIGFSYVFNAEDLWAHGSGKALTPLDVLDYCYAVLHSRAYREKYKEFLKSDFPRIPFPVDAKKFRTLVKLGAKLRQLHLLEWEGIDRYLTTYPIGGSNEVTRKMAAKSPGFEATGNGLGKVWINDSQYFAGVPEAAWNFYIGGYQPAQKWLKDRHGRTLTFDDVRHWQRIIVALTETGKVMEEVDKTGVV